MNATRKFLLIAAIATVSPRGHLVAELPTLNQPPYIGLYAGYDNKRVRITLTHQGVVVIRPYGLRDVPVPEKAAVKLLLGAEETSPGGAAPVWRGIDVASLTSKQPASDDFETAELQGRLQGGAPFTAAIENQRGLLTIRGRVTGPAAKAGTTASFAVRVIVPDPYPYSKPAGKAAKEEFKQRLEDDRLLLRWLDRTRKSHDFAKPIDAAAAAVHGPGIVEAEVKVSAYDRHDIRVISNEFGRLRLSNAANGPLRDGFEIRWIQQDERREASGQASLQVGVR